MWVSRGLSIKGKIMDRSGRVIALKWRPRQFDEIVGQEHITRVIQNSIKNNHISHAYLFTGIRGVGKTSTARILAKALNCRKEGPTPYPCDECESCIAIQEGISLDVVEIDAASNRGINEIRELRENINFKPASERFRIYIIDEVHMLTTEAFNALLKTLEEPPEHVIFILATTEVHKLPKTVVSRCQQFDFKAIPYGLMFERLKKICEGENFKISDEALSVVIRKSGGSMRDAESVLQKLISFGGSEISNEDVYSILGVVDVGKNVEIFKSIIDGNSSARVLEILNGIYESGYDIVSFYRDFALFLRDILTYKITGKKELISISSPDEINLIISLSEKVDEITLLRCIDLMYSHEYKLKNSYFPNFYVELIFLKLSLIKKLLSPEEVLRKIGGITGRVKNVVPEEKIKKGEIKSEENKGKLDKTSSLEPDLDTFLEVIRSQMPNIFSFLPAKENISLKNNKLFLRYDSPKNVKMKMLKINIDRLIDIYSEKFGSELKVEFSFGEKSSEKAEFGNVPGKESKSLIKNSAARTIIEKIPGDWEIFKNGEKKNE